MPENENNLMKLLKTVLTPWPITIGKQPEMEPYDEFEQMKLDTYQRFWPEKAAPLEYDTPLRNPFTGTYNMEEVVPILKPLAFLYNSQVLSSDPGFSAGGAGASRPLPSVGSSRTESKDDPGTVESGLVDFVRDLLSNSAQAQTLQDSASAAQRTGERGEVPKDLDVANLGSMMADAVRTRPGFAEVVRGFSPSDLYSVIAAAGGDPRKPSIPTPRAVAVPDVLRVGAERAPAKAQEARGESNLEDLSNLGTMMGKMIAATGGSEPAKAQEAWGESNFEDLSNLGTMMGKMVAATGGSEERDMPTRPDTQRFRQELPPKERPAAESPASASPEVDTSGLPTWAKALIAVGGAGALAAIARNNKDIWPSLAYGVGEGLKTYTGGKLREREIEEQRETETQQAQQERQYDLEDMARKEEFESRKMQEQLRNQLILQQIKDSPDPVKYFGEMPSDLRVMLAASAPEGGEVPQPGSDEFARIASQWIERDLAESAGRQDTSRLRTLTALPFLLTMAPQLKSDPGFVEMLSRMNVDSASLSLLGDLSPEEAFKLLESGVSLFGGE